MNTRRLPLLYLMAAWLCAVIGLALGVFIEPSLFSRIGSIVVLFALMGEFTLLRQELDTLYEHLHDNSGEQYQSPSLWHQKKALISHATVVIGTLIWGFGDMLL